jgi:hypothetical protein
MRGGKEEIYEKSVRISGDPTKIRNSSVTNTSLQPYRFTHLPRKKGVMDKKEERINRWKRNKDRDSNQYFP